MILEKEKPIFLDLNTLLS